MPLQFSIFLILFLQYCAASKESNNVLHFSSALEAREVLAELDIPPLESPSLSSPRPPPRQRPPSSPPPLLPPPNAPPLPSGNFSTIVLLLPIAAVAFMFICTFIWRRNLRNNSAEASSNLRSLDSTTNAPAVPDPASQIQGNNTTENQGLDCSLVNKLPTFLLSATRSTSLKDNQKRRRKDYYSCAVCISDYEEGETLKILPACSHSFHKDCIDIWLLSHSTCPLCRLSLFNSQGDLILLEEEQGLECNIVVDDQHSEIHEAGNTSQSPSDNRVFISPLIRMFRRTQSCVNSTQADRSVAHTGSGAFNFLRRSCSQPAREHKIHPVHE